ncbi:MAG TPA: enoyl-CoA hydratase/isomerase family protein [Nocardioidaceae bacterium]|nr:enoyl-CoA hydratase/isomerase family protein [Nocardioidaceae bacterium]
MPYPTAEQLDEAGLRIDADGPILTVTLDRPDVRNAQTPAMWRALAAIGEAIDTDVRVVVVRGAGAAFSAGLDRRLMTPEGIAGELTFAEIAALSDDEALAQIATFQSAFTWWRRPDILSVAAVQGAAVGAGFQLALACDLRVIAEDARFCMREPTLGLVPDLGGTKPLVEILGYAGALEVCATGRWIEAREAVESGLATVCVPSDELNGTVADLVAALAVAPAGAVQATKALLVDAAGRSYDAQLDAERRAQLGRLRDLTNG